jgi:hypothetical protein
MSVLALLLGCVLLGANAARGQNITLPQTAIIDNGGTEIGIYNIFTLKRIASFTPDWPSPCMKDVDLYKRQSDGQFRVLITSCDGSQYDVGVSAFAPLPQGQSNYGNFTTNNEEPTPIDLSHDANSLSISCNQKYAVACGGNSATPVSVIDLDTFTEISTLALPNPCMQVVCCDDGVSVLVLEATNEFPRKGLGIRRLTISETGQLADTGEFLAVPGARGVMCAPGSMVGIVYTQDAVELTPDRAISFAINGLTELDDVSFGTTEGRIGISGALDCAGERLYLSSGGNGSGSALDLVEVFSLNSLTGDIGNEPECTIPTVFQTLTLGGEYLAASSDGSQVWVLGELAGTNTTEVHIFDPVTGELIDTISDLNQATGIYVPSCCLALEPPTEHILTSLVTAGPDRDGNQVIDETIPVKSNTPSEFSFTVIYSSPGTTGATITDTIPKEWEIISIVSDDPADEIEIFSPGFSFRSLFKKKTTYEWTPTDSAGAVTITIRTDSIRRNKYGPNKAGTYDMNAGAKALNADGTPVLDDAGAPLVGPKLTIEAF